MNILDMKFKGQMIGCKSWVVGGLVKRAKNQDGVTVHVGIKQDGCNTVEVIPESVGLFVGSDLQGTDLYSGDLVKDIDNDQSWLIEFDIGHGAVLVQEQAKIYLYESEPLEDWVLFQGNIHD